MSFAGVRGTGDFATDERPKNFREMILRIQPNGDAPMFALTSKMASESVDDPEFSWFEEENYVPSLRVSAGLSSAVASTTVDFNAIDGAAESKGNALDLRVGDLLQVDGTSASSEIVEVSSITDSNTIVVKRGAAGTTADGVAANAYLTLIGNAFEEGSASANTGSKNPSKKFNYTQIFKNAFELTRTVQKTKARTGDPMKNDAIRTMFRHSSGIEFAMLFGERSEVTGAGGKPKRTMRGLTRYITSNRSTLNSATFTQTNVTDFLGDVFKQTADGVPNQRLVYAGNGFLNKLNDVIASASNTQFQFTGTLKLYGQDLRTYVTPDGEIAIKTHPLMSNHWLYKNSAVVWAPPAVRYRYITDTKREKDIGNNDVDGQKDQWLTECGLEVHHESLHGFLHYDPTA